MSDRRQLHLDEVWSDDESAYFNVPSRIQIGDQLFVTKWVKGYTRIWAYTVVDESIRRTTVSVDIFSGTGPSGWSRLPLLDEQGTETGLFEMPHLLPKTKR